MSYRALFKKENDQVRERYDLAVERIGLMLTEHTVSVPYEDYFQKTAAFILMMDRLSLSVERDELIDADKKRLYHIHELVYEDISSENYGKSYANPAYAVKILGKSHGLLLSALYAKIRLMIIYAWECRRMEMTISMELFIEIYNYFEAEKVPDPKLIHQAIYWFISDYSDVTLTYRLREQLDPSLDFMTDIVMHQNLDDDCYLYRYGAYIGDDELKTAALMREKSQHEIDEAAVAAVEKYVRNFNGYGTDKSKERTVHIRFDFGLERLVRAVVLKFYSHGFKPVINRQYDSSLAGDSVSEQVSGMPAQYVCDHRYDAALFLDKALAERCLSVLKVSYESMKALAASYTGTVVFKVLKDEAPVAEKKGEVPGFSEKQMHLIQLYANQGHALADRYVQCSLRETVTIKYGAMIENES